MKTLLISFLFVSIIGTNSFAVNYVENDGSRPPETFTSKTDQDAKKGKENKVASPTTSRSGLSNSSGITTDEMNTSINPAPATDEEVLKNTTLTRGRLDKFDPINPGEIEAQEEENALDYSTTPEKQVTPQDTDKKDR